MMGSCLWEEALNDMIVEDVVETVNSVPKIYAYKVFGRPKPEDADKLECEIYEKVKKMLECLQKTAECRGKKYILSDKVSVNLAPAESRLIFCAHIKQSCAAEC